MNKVIPIARLIIPVLKNQGYSFPKINKTETPMAAMANTRGNNIGIADVKLPSYLMCCDRNTDRYKKAQATAYESIDS